MKGNTKQLVFGVCIAILLFFGFVGVASARTIYVPDDHEKIQWAVNNATDGDTIIVRSGTYYENVDVNKKLTLKGLGYPVVNAGGSGSAITISADGVTVEGFTVTNSSYYWWSDAGIKVISSNNIITSNNVLNNRHGIILRDSSDNTIISNNISNNWGGIFLWKSSNNTITSNLWRHFGVGFCKSKSVHINDYIAK